MCGFTNWIDSSYVRFGVPFRQCYKDTMAYQDGPGALVQLEIPAAVPASGVYSPREGVPLSSRR
jgi:hypothetical protein